MSVNEVPLKRREVSAPLLTVFLVGAHAGSGNSTVAAGMADAAARKGVSAAVMEVAPPYRSSYLSGNDSGRVFNFGAKSVLLRVNRRPSGAQVVRLDSSDPDERMWSFDPNACPEPLVWLAAGSSPEIAIVDFSWPLNEVIETNASMWLGETSFPTAVIVTSTISNDRWPRAEHCLSVLEQAGWPDAALAIVGDSSDAIQRSAGPRVMDAFARSVQSVIPIDMTAAKNGPTADSPQAVSEACSHHLLHARKRMRVMNPHSSPTSTSTVDVRT